MKVSERARERYIALKDIEGTWGAKRIAEKEAALALVNEAKTFEDLKDVLLWLVEKAHG